MPEPWLPFFSKGPLLITLHGIHCYSENGQTHKVHICYCWPCDLSSIQTFPWEKLRKAVIIAPYPDQLVVIFLIFYIPPLWDTFQLTDHSAKQKKTLLTRPQSSPVVTDSLFSFQFTGQLCMRMRKPAHRTAPFNSTWQLFEQEPLANESGRKGETTTCKDDVKENFTGRTNGTWSFCYIHLRIHRTSSNLLCPNHIVNGWKWRGGGFNYMFWCDVKAPITSIGKVQAARSCAYVFHMRVVFQNHQLYP